MSQSHFYAQRLEIKDGEKTKRDGKEREREREKKGHRNEKKRHHIIFFLVPTSVKTKEEIRLNSRGRTKKRWKPRLARGSIWKLGKKFFDIKPFW